MKKTVIITLLALFAFNVSCGSSSSSADTTPREAKIIALTGTLMAFVADVSAMRVIYDEAITAASGTISTPLQKTFAEFGLEGTSDDLITVDSGSWLRTENAGITTLAITDLGFNSDMIEYPWNNTTPFAGAVISFDNIDFTVAASTDTTKITGTGAVTIKGTGTLSDLTPTECTATGGNLDIGTMNVSILAPSTKLGTVSFQDAVFGCGIYNGDITISTLLTAIVGYDGQTYSCSIIAGYTASMPGNTGIGEMTITSANCTLE